MATFQYHNSPNSVFVVSRIFTLSNTIAQDKAKSEKIQSGWGNLNYAVPESPTFKIMGLSPSNILRSVSTRDIAVSVGNYLVSTGAVIPNNLTIEVSPGLFNPKVSLSEYG